MTVYHSIKDRAFTRRQYILLSLYFSFALEEKKFSKHSNSLENEILNSPDSLCFTLKKDKKKKKEEAIPENKFHSSYLLFTPYSPQITSL